MAVKRTSPRTRGATKTARPIRRRAIRANAPHIAKAAAISAGARTEYRIYPSIGIARVGDSKEGFIIGPEAPGVVPEGPFRGKDDGIKPQGARFRVFRVDIDANENETVRGEVTGAPDVQIEWTVQLANRKAAARQIFGDGNGTLTRNSAATFRNAGFDRDRLVIAAAASITNAAGATATRMSGAIAFARAGKVHTASLTSNSRPSARTPPAGSSWSAGPELRALRRTPKSRTSPTTTAGMTAYRMVR